MPNTVKLNPMMPFSRKIFHAIEAVLYVALHHTTHPISGRALADRQNLPPRYLEHILQDLVHSGILRSIRGPRGGYLLARERRRITIGHIVDILSQGEDDSDTQKAPLTPLAEAVVLPYCHSIGDIVRAELHKTTLAQLCEQSYSLQLTTPSPSSGTKSRGGSPKKQDFVI
jgi:Rrf2 family iron-sulfur cluster assembly transcriptional regulator